MFMTSSSPCTSLPHPGPALGPASSYDQFWGPHRLGSLVCRSSRSGDSGPAAAPRRQQLRAVSAARTPCIESSMHTVSSTHTPSGVPSWHSRSTCTLRRPRYRVAPPSVPSWHSRSTCTRRRRGGLPARQSGSGQPKPGWRRRRRPGTRTESRGLGFPGCVTAGFAAAAAAARRARWRPVSPGTGTTPASRLPPAPRRNIRWPGGPRDSSAPPSCAARRCAHKRSSRRPCKAEPLPPHHPAFTCYRPGLRPAHRRGPQRTGIRRPLRAGSSR